MRVKPQDDRPGEPADRIIASLTDLAGALGRLNDLIAQRLGIAQTDLLCLHVLNRAGARTAGALGSRLGRSTGAVTHMIDRLEKAGYVQRKPDPQDRRRVLVEAFAPGLERIASFYEDGRPQPPPDGHLHRRPARRDLCLPSGQLRQHRRRVRPADPVARAPPSGGTGGRGERGATGSGARPQLGCPCCPPKPLESHVFPCPALCGQGEAGPGTPGPGAAQPQDLEVPHGHRLAGRATALAPVHGRHHRPQRPHAPAAHRSGQRRPRCRRGRAAHQSGCADHRLDRQGPR